MPVCALLALASVLGLVSGALCAYASFANRSEARLIMSGQSLPLLVARTQAEHFKGLSGRASLDPYAGMLFVFPRPGQYPLVMRDMEFALDMVWIYEGKIVDIAHNTGVETGVPEEQLRLYQPRSPANLILELRSGSAQKYGLKIGDSLDLAGY